jgi:hypothetical protein
MWENPSDQTYTIYQLVSTAYNTSRIGSQESFEHFPNAQGYAGVRACGLRPVAVVQQPNELVELAEVPGAEARIVREIGVFVTLRAPYVIKKR